MPIYEYCCEECDHVFEVLQSGFDERREACPLCQGESKRVISNTSFVLKGSGWYVTDYAGKNPSNGGSNGAGNNGGAKSADAASGDAKSGGEAKAEAPASKPASKPACGCAKSCSASS